MHVIKLKYDSEDNLESYFSEYNKLKRIAYNQLLDERSLLESVNYILQNIKTFLDRSFINQVCLDAQSIYRSQKEIGQTKIVFGKKKNLTKRSKGRISKEKWEQLRNPYIAFNGSKHDNFGNRKFKLDIDNNQVTFKPQKGDQFKLSFQCSEKQRKLLEKVQYLAENKQFPISYRITRTHICISIDEERLAKLRNNFISNRILSIDSNPNYIGISICDYYNEQQKEIRSQVFDLLELNKKCNKNKRHHEIFEISKQIIKLAKHYECETIVVEKLEIQNKDHKKGKIFNRNLNNLWNRKKFIQNLNKHCNFESIKFIEIIPEYSSFVGCLNNPSKIDSIAAALEIGRRANLFVKIYYKKEFSTGKKIIFPKWDKSLMNRWKEELGEWRPKSWLEAYQWFRENPKFSYRVLLKDCMKNLKLFRCKSRKSNIFLYLY